MIRVAQGEGSVNCSKCGADLGAEVKTTRFDIEVKTEPCQGCIDDAVDKEEA